MPKKIKDLEKKILDSVTSIFLNEGYEAIDMRRIAKEAGIAVGTLYNYYPNKKDLVSHLFKELWKESIDNLQKVIDNTSILREELVVKYIKAFYEEMSKKNGLGHELMRLEFQETGDFHKMKWGTDIFLSLHIVQIKELIQKGYALTDESIDKLDLDMLAYAIEVMLIGFKQYEMAGAQQYILFMKNVLDAYVQQYR
ncbi:TetR/AcrR family transcriptional regulator [Vallitalea okinawensis]|uniref:TetR/AcrR family transcriptional regulator n=1 Tax=Vallitalea okinawensis TaxID=2078660 RepID=UPI0013004499|nr:TetR/AcrR family transcriptional regulator [Vallitalea okinawensis]